MTDYENLRFYVAPRDACQIVEVAYAMADDGETIVMRTTDRGCGAVSYSVAEVLGGSFEPCNGRLPEIGDWEDIIE